MSWTWLLLAIIACFAFKVAGFLVPQHALAHPAVARTVDAAPVALLAGLIAVQTVASSHDLVIDWRLAGLGTATVAIWLRAPLLVVVTSAAVVTALLRLATG